MQLALKVVKFLASIVVCLVTLPAQSQKATELLEIRAKAHPEIVQSFVEGFLASHPPNRSLDQLSHALIHSLHHSGYALATVEAGVGSDGGFVGLVINLGEIIEFDLRGFQSQKDEAAVRRILLKYLDGQPVHQARLERAMMLVDDLSGIAARFHLEEMTPGVYSLIVENSPIGATASVLYDYLPTREFERNRLSLTYRRPSTLRAGDTLRVNALAIAGDGQPRQYGGGLYFRAPLLAAGTYASLNISDLRSQVTAAPVQRLDFDGRSYNLTIGHPSRRDIHGYGYIIAELQRTEEEIESLPVNTVDVARLVAVVAHNTTMARRIEGFLSLSAGESEVPGEGAFRHLRFGLAASLPSHALVAGSYFKLDFLGQLSGEQVPSSEKAFLGSTEFLRGYQYSTESGDSGVITSMEFGADWNTGPEWIWSAKHALFWDLGAVRSDQDDADSEWKSLQSVGYRFEFGTAMNFHLRGWVAAPLSDPSVGEKPDPNIYVQIGKSW